MTSIDVFSVDTDYRSVRSGKVLVETLGRR